MVGPSPIKKPPKIAPKKDLGGDNVKDQLSEDLRQAIWPLYDDELFIKILNQNPDLMTFKSGPSQETLLHRYSRVQKSIENFVFRPKMAIFWRAGMREGGLPLPLAFQYLILMI